VIWYFVGIGRKDVDILLGSENTKGGYGSTARRPIPVRPICTPQLPSSHTYAPDFFLAGEDYDLVAPDRSMVWG
jgi:hypothetical protein